MDVNAVHESFHEHVTLIESSCICDSCGKKYQTKSGLQKHLSSKTRCVWRKFEIRMSDLQIEVYHEGSCRRPCKQSSWSKTTCLHAL